MSLWYTVNLYIHEDIIEISENCHKYLRNFEEALKPKQKAYEEECSKTGDTQVSRCIALFQILQRRGCKTWRDFEHEFSRFSIFCGRNPMVLSGRRSEPVNQLEAQSPPPYPSASDSDQTLKDTHQNEHKTETNAESGADTQGSLRETKETGVLTPDSQETNTSTDGGNSQAGTDAEECKHNSAESVEELHNEDILMLDSHHENITTNVLSSIKTADTLLNGENPSLKDLTNVVVPEISAEWPALGLQLNITSARLNQIQADYPRDCRRCCTEMLSEWLSQDAGASWPTLIAALKSRAVDKTELAGCLEKYNYSCFPS